MSTPPKPLGMTVNRSAQDAQIELRLIKSKLMDILKAGADNQTVVGLTVDAIEHVDSAESYLRTVIEHTGRGKSEQYHR